MKIINLSSFVQKFVDNYNKQLNLNYKIIDFEQSDLSLPETINHNFIYVLLNLTDNSQEYTWYFKLIPVEYYNDSIKFLYYPLSSSPKIYNPYHFSIFLEKNKLEFTQKPQFEI